MSIGGATTFVQLGTMEDSRLERVKDIADRHAKAAFGRFVVNNPGASALSMTLSHHPVPLRSLEDAGLIGAPPSRDRLDENTMVILTVIALTVVLVAALNAGSLQLSQAIREAPTIAVRRAFGASRSRISRALLGRAIFIALFAGLAGLTIAVALNEWFASLISRVVPRWPDVRTLLTIVSVTICTGVIVGSYAAYASNRFRPSEILSARNASAPGARWIRPGLIALQIASAAATIVFAVSVSLQLNHLSGENLGFSPKHLVAYRLSEPLLENDPRRLTLESSLRSIGGVTDVSTTAVLPTEGSVSQTPIRVGQIMLEATRASISDQYFAALSVQPLAGRFHQPADMRRASESDQDGGSVGVVISRGLSRRLGFHQPDESVGALLRGTDPRQFWQVIGVVPDLPVGQIRREDHPFAVYTAGDSPARFVMLRTDPSSRPNYAEIDAAVGEVFPNLPVDRFSLEERVRTAFSDISRMRGIVIVFGILVTTTAAVGVLAMATDRARLMRNEVAVRKTFGARVPSILNLLVSRLAPPLVFGLACGLAIGLVGTQTWMMQFVTRTDYTIVSVTAAVSTLMIAAAVAMASEAWKLARIKPVEALRVE